MYRSIFYEYSYEIEVPYLSLPLTRMALPIFFFFLNLLPVLIFIPMISDNKHFDCNPIHVDEAHLII